MSIVTFWNNGKEQTGKTLSVVAIATYMAIEHNYKILVVSTGYQTQNLNNCFWEQQQPKKKNFGLFGPNTNSYIGNGIQGLVQIMKSNKLSPEIITNYTKIIFKDRLEILQSFMGEVKEYKEASGYLNDIIALANNYYDLVFVDLDNTIGEENKETILKNSTVIVATLSQRLTSINSFIEYREGNPLFDNPKVLLLIGRYDRYSKYSLKNITRYMREKNKISTIPYNTLYFEACEEAQVPDLFLRFRKLKDEEDRNYLFISEVKRASENIIYRLQDLRMKM